MILLRPDCLVFETASGENIPCSAKEVTLELIGETAEWLDRETLENAAAAVLHYFRVEQKRTSVSVAEFSEALEKVLSGLGLESSSEVSISNVPIQRRWVEADLALLAGDGGELFFFPRLRDEVQSRLNGTPLVLRFHGLRACVKQLTGAKRWSSQCRALNDEIVEYLRTCFTQQKAGTGSALVVL
ncbi:MAG: hypothetical protein QOF48_471 [Verrucomicrobiota bacterium]|jgi:hypothetical protein